MPNVASVLKEEITRLARSEIKKQVDPLKKRIQELRKTVTEQKKHIAALEKAQSQGAKRAKKAPDVAPPTAEEGAPSARKITVASIKAQRKRLNLSQREIALLLGVSQPTVGRWEQGKGSPRGENRDAFVALRGMGRRQVKERLEEMAK